MLRGDSVTARSKHLLAETFYYYVAIIVNVCLRFMWVVKLTFVSVLLHCKPRKTL